MKKNTNCVQGVLSPLLSNIVLDELDNELAQRGHSFVRYADDVKIFVSSQQRAEAVKLSLFPKPRW